MLTSLYFTNVFPASTPWADLKITVIVGPSLMIRCTAIPIATSAANSGTIHTMEMRLCVLGTTVAWGKLPLSAINVSRAEILSCSAFYWAHGGGFRYASIPLWKRGVIEGFNLNFHCRD